MVCFNSVLCLAPRKVIQDSLGSWIPRFGFRILGTGFQYLSVGTWILDSNRFWDSGFLELYFQIPKPRIPDSTSKNFPDSITWGELSVLGSVYIEEKLSLVEGLLVYPSYNGHANFSYISLQNLTNRLHQKQNVGSARRMTHLARSPFLIGTFTLLAGPTFHHINTLAGLPSPILNSNSNRLIWKGGSP